MQAHRHVLVPGVAAALARAARAYRPGASGGSLGVSARSGSTAAGPAGSPDLCGEADLAREDRDSQLDQLRGELYRIADALVHASPDERSRLASEFEETWTTFKSVVMKHR